MKDKIDWMNQMIMESKIRILSSKIEEYFDARKELEHMVDMWENHDDPLSDPGLQFEQVNKVDGLYNDIKKIAQTL